MIKCENCGCEDMFEFDPREEECTEGQDCEYMAHEINNEVCFMCDKCGSFNWIENEGEENEGRN